MITTTDYVEIEKMVLKFLGDMKHLVTLDMADYDTLKNQASHAVSTLISSADGSDSPVEALEKSYATLSCHGVKSVKSVMFSLCAHNIDVISQDTITRLIEAECKTLGTVPVIWGAGEDSSLGEGEWRLLNVVFYE